MYRCKLLLLLIASSYSAAELPDLPIDHYPFYLTNNRKDLHICSSDARCNKSTATVNSKSCWGYELNCAKEERYLLPECSGDSKGWAKSKAEQVDIFDGQADFKYISERRKELKTYCKANTKTGSTLECTSHARLCRGKKIAIDFSGLIGIKEPMKYSGDVLSDGQVMAAQCDYDKESFSKLGAHKSPLQSWFEEMEHFTVVEKLECDITIDKPVYIMKLDATVNMYHHFCDFVNLYLTQHLNNSFGLDNNILIWDTFPYRSNFGLTFKAFTKNPIMNLSSFRGKKVCFDDVVFSFLPRMLFGLYYNMPLISGCKSSGLFRAFNRHVLHRLAIKSDSATASGSERIRITLLSRSTQFRKILNEKELISALQNSSTAFDVRRVDFTFSTPFQEQLEIIANTDILIGMHGAGLTHCLFLPDWAVLFELYNCDDANCYKDLASLRGVKYYTWQKSNKVFSQDEGKHPQLGAHKKFTNYAFDKDEFVRIVMTAVEHVRQNRQVTPGGVKDEL